MGSATLELALYGPGIKRVHRALGVTFCVRTAYLVCAVFSCCAGTVCGGAYLGPVYLHCNMTRAVLVDYQY